MHKILKYEEPSQAMQSIQYITNLFNQNYKYSDAASKLEAEKAAKIGNIQGGINIASQLAPIGLNLFGAKKAETMGGTQQGIMQGLDLVGDNLIKYGGLPGAIAGGVMKAGKMLNEYGGKTSDSQFTLGGDTGAYGFQAIADAGKKFSFIDTYFGRKKNKNKLQNTNRLTAQADYNNIQAINATNDNKKRMLEASGSLPYIMSKSMTELSGGMNNNVISVKSGGALKSVKIIKARVGAKIKKAQSGEALDLGKVEDAITQNVIPEGALHARLNNYEGDLGEQVTNKGIPVITYEKGDKILQHAEIEHSEIIFNKTTSDKLEALYKEYKDANDSRKKELEIECGKLLTVEILENTNDNVGLLNNIE